MHLYCRLLFMVAGDFTLGEDRTVKCPGDRNFTKEPQWPLVCNGQILGNSAETNFFLLFFVTLADFKEDCVAAVFPHKTAHFEAVQSLADKVGGEAVNFAVMTAQLQNVGAAPLAARLVAVDPGQLVLQVGEHVALQVAGQHFLAAGLAVQRRLLPNPTATNTGIVFSRYLHKRA